MVFGYVRQNAQQLTRYVAARENDEFELFNESTFPLEAKRTRSAAIRQCIADRIIRHLKCEPEDDRKIRHFVKKRKWLCVVGCTRSGDKGCTFVFVFDFYTDPSCSINSNKFSVVNCTS